MSKIQKQPMSKTTTSLQPSLSLSSNGNSNTNMGSREIIENKGNLYPCNTRSDIKESKDRDETSPQFPDFLRPPGPDSDGTANDDRFPDSKKLKTRLNLIRTLNAWLDLTTGRTGKTGQVSLKEAQRKFGLSESELIIYGEGKRNEPIYIHPYIAVDYVNNNGGSTESKTLMAKWYNHMELTGEIKTARSTQSPHTSTHISVDTNQSSSAASNNNDHIIPSFSPSNIETENSKLKSELENINQRYSKLETENSGLKNELKYSKIVIEAKNEKILRLESQLESRDLKYGPIAEYMDRKTP